MKLSETLLQVDPYSGAKKKGRSLRRSGSYPCMSDENIGSDRRDGKKGIQYSQVLYSKYGFLTDVNEAKKLFDAKVSELDCMSEDTYKKEALGLQLLRDFITENEIKKDKPVEIISDSVTRAVLSYSFDVEERENGKSADSKSRERKKSDKGVVPIAGISKSDRNEENMPPEDIPAISQLIERGDLEGLMEKSEELSIKSHLFYKSSKKLQTSPHIPQSVGMKLAPQSGSMYLAPQSGSMYSAPQSGSMYSAPQSVGMKLAPQSGGMFHGAIQGMPQSSAMYMPQSSAMSMPQSSAMPMPQSSAMYMPQSSAMSMPQSSAMSMPQSSAMPMPQASGMFKYLATDDMSPQLLSGKSIPQKPFPMDQASDMLFKSLSEISPPQPTMSALSGMSDTLQPMMNQAASFGMSGLSVRPQSYLGAGVEAKQQQQQQHFECSEAVPVLPMRHSLSPSAGRAPPKPTSKVHGSLLTAYAPPPPPAYAPPPPPAYAPPPPAYAPPPPFAKSAPPPPFVLSATPPPPTPYEPLNLYAKYAPPPPLANYAPPPPLALSTPLPKLTNYAPPSEIQGMMYSRQIAGESLERSPRKSGGSKLVRKEKEQRAPVLDECLDQDDMALGMSLKMSMEIGDMEDDRLMERLRQLSSDARFTDTRNDEQERSPRRSSSMMIPSRKEIAPSLSDMDNISEKIFSLQREEGNWEISDLSVISFYLHKSTEQILQEISQSGAKSLGASVYSKLLHFIPTLILLFFLHTAYPRSFELSPSFISWTVIPPKWKPPGDKALSFIRLFNKQNPSLSSRLDLATSWYQYAEKQIKTPDQ